MIVYATWADSSWDRWPIVNPFFARLKYLSSTHPIGSPSLPESVFNTKPCGFSIFPFYSFAGWWLSPTPLKNMKVSWGYYSQYMESHKIDVPNHQPDHIILCNIHYYYPWNKPLLTIIIYYYQYVGTYYYHLVDLGCSLDFFIISQTWINYCGSHLSH